MTRVNDPGSTEFNIATVAHQQVGKLAEMMDASFGANAGKQMLRDEEAARMNTQQLAEVLDRPDLYDFAAMTAARDALKLRIKQQAQDKLVQGLEYYQKQGASLVLLFMIQEELELREKAAHFQANRKTMYRNNSAIMDACPTASLFKVQFKYKPRDGYAEGFQARPCYSRDTADDRANTATQEQRDDIYKQLKRYGPKVFEGKNGYDYAMRQLRKHMQEEKQGNNNVAEYAIYWNQYLTQQHCFNGIQMLPVRIVHWHHMHEKYTTGPYEGTNK